MAERRPIVSIGGVKQEIPSGDTLAVASNGLASATTTVVVSSAAAPSSGQVLTASSGTAASWQTPALGYGTGAGGEVTQTKSKDQSVTLNKLSGRITTSNGVLGAGVTVTFGFSNSLISMLDTIVMTLVNTAGSRRYTLEFHIANNGLVYVSITNVTTASLSETLLLNFVVIKGSVSRATTPVGRVLRKIVM